LPHTFGDDARTLIVTTKGQFVVDGIRSGFKGKMVFVTKWNDGRYTLELEDSDRKSVIYGL